MGVSAVSLEKQWLLGTDSGTLEAKIDDLFSLIRWFLDESIPDGKSIPLSQHKRIQSGFLLTGFDRLNRAIFASGDCDSLYAGGNWANGVAGVTVEDLFPGVHLAERFKAMTSPQTENGMLDLFTVNQCSGENLPLLFLLRSLEERALIASGELQWVLLAIQLSEPVELWSAMLSAYAFHFAQEKECREVEKKKLCSLQEEMENNWKIMETRWRFISMVSHEFRTPLASIQASADMLRLYDERITHEVRLDRFRKIDNSVARMRELLDDVAHFARADSGELELKSEKIDVKRICQELIDESLPSHEMLYNFHVLYDNLCADYFSDSRAIRHILGNMLSNAVKYSPPYSDIEISIKCKEDLLSIKVSDSGIGIRGKDMGQIFQPFFRGGNVGSRPGTGLGLAIIQRFVILLNGSVQMDSNEGSGTTITVHLPAVCKSDRGC